MALTRAEREARRAEVLEVLRAAWDSRGKTKGVVVVTLQNGRKRPQFAGTVARVATSGAWVKLDDGGDDLLHVPVDRIVQVTR